MKSKLYEFAAQPKTSQLTESIVAVGNNSSDRNYFTLLGLQAYERINIGGYNICVDSFLKRRYIFKDDKTEVFKGQLKRAHIFPDDGTILVEGKPVIWDNIYKRNTPRGESIQIGGENPISWDAFLKRTYYYKETGERVDRSLLANAKIYENGTVQINGKVVVRGNPTLQFFAAHSVPPEYTNGFSIKNLCQTDFIRIGKRIIYISSFLKRNYIFQDNGQKVSKKQLRKATIFPDGTVSFEGRVLKWNRLKKGIDSTIQMGEENPVDREGFLKRTYYKETGERVDSESLNSEDGTVRLLDKVLVRKKPSVQHQQKEEEISSYSLQPEVRNEASPESEGVHLNSKKRKWDQIATPSSSGFFSDSLAKESYVMVEQIEEGTVRREEPSYAEELESTELVSIPPEVLSLITEGLSTEEKHLIQSYTHFLG